MAVLAERQASLWEPDSLQEMPMRSKLPAPGRRFSFWTALAAALIFLLPSTARAQNLGDNSKWELGGHYATLNLPSQCNTSLNCDTKNNGLGANLTYNFSAWMGLDTEMNFFADNGNESTALTGGRVTEGLFGLRLGPTTRTWGLYSEVRPGFVTFGRVLGASPQASSSALLPSTTTATAAATPSMATTPTVPTFTARLGYQTDGSTNPLAVLGLTSSTDFAFNYGEVIEYRPTRHFALRFDVGDTIVTYPHSSIGTPFHQHNFQISEAFVIRF